MPPVLRNYKWIPNRVEHTFNYFARRGWLPIMLMLLAVAAAWGFVGLASEVSENETEPVDIWLLERIGGRYDTVSPYWREAGRDVTALGGSAIITLMVAFVSLFLLFKKQWKSAIFVVVSVIGGLAISLLLKGVYARDRPDLFAHETYTMTDAFPSGHSTNSAVAYFAIAVLLTKLVSTARMKAYIFAVGLFIPFLVGFSRVFLRVHWPTDVLGGWLLGLAWGLLVWAVATFLQRQGAIEPEGDIERPPILNPS